MVFPKNSQGTWGIASRIQDPQFLVEYKSPDNKASLKVRQSRNVFFQADDSSKKRTNIFVFLPNSTMIELFRCLHK